MIPRTLKSVIDKRLNTGKAIIVLGPRQTGKTTLLTLICEEQGRWLLLNCDDPIVRTQLEDANETGLKRLLGNHTLIFIDEAQRVRNIGLTLKIIVDRIKNVQLLVSGSSGLEIANEVNEPLTGRKWEYLLYPISWQEFAGHTGFLETERQLEHRLVFGMYPEIITHAGQETEILLQLSGSYLYKDLLSLKGVRKPDLLEKLLKALALQLGNEVSYNELSQLLEVDKKTIVNYLDLLEKAFVIFRLQPFSRNLRNEINTSRKIYFFDNGIRNALIANFQPINVRSDVGALWENFLIGERAKYLHYHSIWANKFFWRTHQRQEIDYIEEFDGILHAYEFKWNPVKKARFPKTFINTYPNHQLETVNRKNYREFVTGESV